MATAKQVKAAKQNVQKAQRAATKKRTIANLPKSTRDALVEQAQRGRRRGGQATRSKTATGSSSTSSRRRSRSRVARRWARAS